MLRMRSEGLEWRLQAGLTAEMQPGCLSAQGTVKIEVWSRVCQPLQGEAAWAVFASDCVAGGFVLPGF